MSTVLVTGFGPFRDVRHNPSQAALALLPARIEGARVVTAALPVDPLAAPSILTGLALLQPRLVLHTGVAVGRPVLSFERFATNRLVCEPGDLPTGRALDEPVLPGAAPQLPTRIPEDLACEAWRRARVPHEASDSAGSFLCNQVFFLALTAFPASVPVGFVHVPPDETLGAALDTPHLPLAATVRGLVALLEALLREA
jgi:pyroglutamyl-peptidase